MKKMTQIYAMAFVSIAAIAGCQQEIIDSYEGDNIKKVYASLEESSETKTSLNDKEVFWSSDDRIAVFLKNTLRKRFDITPESAGSKKGTFLYDSDYIVTGNNVKIPNNIAYYPFSDVICTRNGDLYIIDNVSLPETQSYVPESFGEESFPMLAVTNDIEDVDFAFRNVCGALAFQLKGSGKIRSISLQGNSEELLSGKAVITAALGENPKISLLPEGNKTVTLDCGAAGVELKNDISTSFFFTLPPVDFKNGFTITVTDINGGTEEYSTSRENSILRSTILRMPEKEYIGTNTSLDHDYVDEYGVNHGPGVEIDGVVWAPVNCGYHKDDFKYGKLYQWGRKYGQGYSGLDYNIFENVADAILPEIKEGGVSLANGQSKDNSKVFFLGNPENDNDWVYPSIATLWNSGTESNPLKTEYDPCPEGWRVPTYTELEQLITNKSSWIENDKNQQGYWFCGSLPYSASAPQVFFPATGSRDYDDGTAYSRGFYGIYWSSKPNDNYTYNLSLYSGYAGMTKGNYERSFGYPVRCVKYDKDFLSVTSVSLDTSSLMMHISDTYTLSVVVNPMETNSLLHWWSDDESIVAVDQIGNVTAISSGTTTITVMAGMQTATCTVTVSRIEEAGDYVDEYGVNHGPGVEIDGVVWAPVNCGYHKDDFKYGKLYQWGRKYGQGYSGEFWDWNFDSSFDFTYSTYSDSTIPENIPATVSLSEVQSQHNENKFYYMVNSPWDWCSPPNGTLWNSGTEMNPMKTEYDPCPLGWRIPTYAEIEKLSMNYSSFTCDDKDRPGRWFTGSTPYTATVFQLFLPAAGLLYCRDGDSCNRGIYGYYWSSRPSIKEAYELCFHSSYNPSVDTSYRALGLSVRCVQE